MADDVEMSDTTEDVVSPVEESPEEAAPQEDESLAESNEEETPEEASEEEDTEEAPVTGHSEAYKKLLSKYGGDPDKLAAAYWEQANSSSRLHQEMQEIKAYLMKQSEEKVDPRKYIEEDPDVQELNNELTVLRQNAEAIQQEQYGYVTLYGQLEQEIRELRGELKKADDYEKTNLNAEIRSKESEARQALKDISANKRYLAEYMARERDYKRQLRVAEQNATARKNLDRQRELERAHTARLTRDEFNTSLREEAKGLGISVDSQQYAVLNTIIRDRLASYLHSLPEDAPAIDIPKAVQKLTREFSQAMGLKSQFARVSKEKIDTALRTAAVPKKGTPPEPKMPKDIPTTDRTGKHWSAQYARERAKRMLG